ncbi:SDR family oxidoreductase [Dehalobacter sp. DCM]|uniref:SDR family NAD(P)-dependent oxidoreductase n=1 Tax=Dehalobacter sp. DCM TaxID=2907827 RepID=UPI0030820DD6|nr:SDR family oxidoreductase [Dehalobacter sp. DCM]
MGKLTGKVAAVTGGGSGIGKAICLAMSAEGAKVVVGDIGKNPEGKYTAELTVDLIKEAGGEAVASVGDITTMAGGEGLVKAAVDNYGKIDILVNCAGFTRAVDFFEDNEKNWDDIVAVNMKGQFTTTHYAAKEMAKNKSGAIINFSSRAAFVDGIPGPGMSSLPYSASKAGVIGFTTLCSLELKAHGITCNAVLPSAVTPGFPMDRPKFGGGVTSGPEFIAQFVTFLGTDEAKEVTGQFFYVSSGDIAIFQKPLRLENVERFLHKDSWTIDDMIKEVPPLVY